MLYRGFLLKLTNIFFHYQEREARERLEREVLQQRELLSELAREVLRLQIHCSGGARGDWSVGGAQKQEANLSTQLEGTRIV